MKKTTILLIASSILGLGTLSASADNIAKVGSTNVTEEMFKAFAEGRIRKPFSDLTEAESKALNEELIKLVALGVEARKSKVQNDPAVEAQLELQELSYLAQVFIRRHVEQNPAPSDEIQALYEQKYGATPQPEYKARHILVSSPSAAADIIKELDSGADFIEMAAKHSIGPSGKTGGDLGWFTRETMVKEFGDAVSTMSSGSHSSDPVQTQFGWHIILKEDERLLPKPELADVRNELENAFQQKAVADFVVDIRNKAKVKTYD